MPNSIKILVVDLKESKVWEFISPADVQQWASNDPRPRDLKQDHYLIYDVGFWGSREHPKRMSYIDIRSAR